MQSLLLNYLTNCNQYTQCNGIESKVNPIYCGVPQGSTLGPLFFSMYINDLPLHTKFCVNYFEDDTVLILKNKNINNLKSEVNHQLKIMNKWVKFNLLSLNCSKSS